MGRREHEDLRTLDRCYWLIVWKIVNIGPPNVTRETLQLLQLNFIPLTKVTRLDRVCRTIRVYYILRICIYRKIYVFPTKKTYRLRGEQILSSYTRSWRARLVSCTHDGKDFVVRVRRYYRVRRHFWHKFEQRQSSYGGVGQTAAGAAVGKTKWPINTTMTYIYIYTCIQGVLKMILDFKVTSKLLMI